MKPNKPNLSIVRPFIEARALLELDDEQQDPKVIKQTYRRKVVAHPPDRDPEAFRRMRDAYELLTCPGDRAREILLSPTPNVPPPAPPPPPTRPRAGATAVALLRWVVMKLDRGNLQSNPFAATDCRPTTSHPEEL